MTSCLQRDDVTRIELKHPSSVQTTMAGSLTQWLYHGHRIAVYINNDSPSGVIVKLCVEVVPSRGGDSQVSVIVLHATCQVAARGVDIPVLYH